MSLRLKQKTIWYRRLAAMSTTVLLLSFATPGIASAHVLKLDGAIAGILHINPDDSTPIAGRPTDYVVQFDDNTNRFVPPKCNCIVSVINANDNSIVATMALAVSDSNVSENHYTFPRSGVYNLRFTGTPKQAGAFQPFTLTYTVTVAASQTSSQSVSAYLWVGMSAVIILVVAAGYATNRRNHTRRL